MNSSSEKNTMFDHMNTKNLTQAEMDKKKKKRKM